jgi:hypothetical protein
MARQVICYLLLPFLISCSTNVAKKTQFVKQTTVVTQQCKIVAEDNSFTIETGKPIATPLQCLSYTPNPKTLTLPLFKTTDLFDLRDYKFLRFNSTENDGLFNSAKVKVYTASNTTTPLYGLLILSKVPASETGTKAQLHAITISKEDIQKALNGEISFMCERVKNSYRDIEVISWGLWLSSTPFSPDLFYNK